MEDNRSETENMKVLEAVLFASGRAVAIDELSKSINVASPGYVVKLMDKLIIRYNELDSSLCIFKLDNKYVMGLKERYAYQVSEFSGKPDISKGALRILAHISKNEPVMQSSIVKAFGPSSYNHIKELLEKQFIETKKIGRTKSITITNKFSEYFDVK